MRSETVTVSLAWIHEKCMIDKRLFQLCMQLSSREKQPWKKSGIDGIRTLTIKYRSCQTNWELVILWGRNIPVEDEWMKARFHPQSTYIILYIFHFQENFSSINSRSVKTCIKRIKTLSVDNNTVNALNIPLSNLSSEEQSRINLEFWILIN